MPEVPVYVEEVLRVIKEKTGIDWRRKGITRAFLREVENAMAEGVLHKFRLMRWDSPEFQKLISHFTVPEGYFFRYKKQFELLGKRVIPEILMKRERINIASIGSGRGEEVYSIAIVVSENVLPSRRGAIVGFDINLEFIERAKEGIFTKSSFRESFEWEKYFTLREDGYYHVKPELRRMVEFKPLNVLECNSEFKEFFDVIFFRNVLIYIDKDSIPVVTDNVLSMLREGGIIFFGHTDILPNMKLPIEEYERGLFVYRKVGPVGKEERVLDVEARFVGHGKRAEAELEHEMVKKGIMLFNKGNLDDAETVFRNVLRANPRNSIAQAGLMFIMLERGMTEKAVYQIEGVNGSLLLPEVYYLKGLIALNSGKYDVAIEMFDKGLKINPRLPQLRVGKALAHLHRRETEEAKAELEIAEGFLKEELEESTFLPPGGVRTMKMYISELKKIAG